MASWRKEKVLLKLKLTLCRKK